MKSFFIIFILGLSILNAEQVGKASWYSIRTNGGTKTASGKKLNDNHFTAAHKTLPFGTKVKVINLSNGKSAVVSIQDRGPYKKGRVIDVSVAAAKKLSFHKKGIQKVKIQVIKK